jgi:hypothetical protein
MAKTKPKPLGRRAPTDWRHYEKFPLTAATTPTTPTPVAIGVNWYEDFDTPVQKGSRSWIGLNPKQLGKVRGGHCVCLEPGDQLNGNHDVVRLLQDSQSWWDFYDQGREGACVGFGCSRMMSLLNRKRYDARWLWDWAKSTDEWPETNPGDDEGTSVRAGCEILRARGHVAWKAGFKGRSYKQRDKEEPSADEGIGVYRWAKTVDEVHKILKSPANDAAGAVRILNSWGRGYPHRVWMPDETLQRLIDEDGEVALVTDR